MLKIHFEARYGQYGSIRYGSVQWLRIIYEFYELVKYIDYFLFSVGYVRPLASLETLAIWQRADEGNAVVKVVQRGDKFFVCE